MEPDAPPGGHLILSQVLPEPAGFGPRFPLGLLELGSIRVWEPPIRIRLPIPNQIQVDAITFAEIDVREEPVIPVPRLNRLKSQ